MSNNNFSVWDGSVASGFAGGTGTESNPYLINSASQLAFLEKVFNDPNATTNTYYSKYYKLTSNIDLNKREWQPIGNPYIVPNYHNIAIHFNGDNHIIKGLYIDRPNESGQALFGNVYKLSTFKNVTIENAYVVGDINVGGLIGQFASNWEGGIENCHFSGEVRGYQSVGGIAGKGSGEYLRKCTNTGKITCEHSGGGISGGFSGRDSCEITDCINYGTITGRTSIGGINGFSSSRDTFKFCHNYGEIICTGNTFTNGGGITSQYGSFEYCSNSATIAGSGGIVGSGINGYLKNCHNSGTIKGVRNSTGGIAGYATGMNVELCTNTGTVIGLQRTGGICGHSDDNITKISFCRNEGRVTGTYRTGGIAGADNFNVTNCYNRGEVNGESNVGGICGNAVRCADCINDGIITASSSSVGGIAGGVSNEILDCINTGSIYASATYRVGGISGTSAIATRRCYNMGSVFADRDCGGIIGYAYSPDFIIEDCYNAGAIVANPRLDTIGGIVGYVYCRGGKAVNSYYLNESARKGLGYVDRNMTFEYQEGVVSYQEHEAVSALLTPTIMRLAVAIPMLLWSKKKELLLNQMSKLSAICNSFGIQEDDPLPTEIHGDDMYVTVEHSLIRECSNSDSNVVAMCFKNDIIKVLSKQRNSSEEYFKVSLETGQTGYLLHNNVIPAKSVNAVSGFTYRVNVDELKVQRCPGNDLSTSLDTIGSYHRDDTIFVNWNATLTKDSQKWIRVQTKDNRTGWVEFNVLDIVLHQQIWRLRFYTYLMDETGEQLEPTIRLERETEVTVLTDREEKLIRNRTLVPILYDNECRWIDKEDLGYRIWKVSLLQMLDDKVKWSFKDIAPIRETDVETTVPRYSNEGRGIKQADIDEINRVMDKYEINRNVERVRHFISQCHAESEGGFMPIETYNAYLPKYDDRLQDYSKEGNTLGNIYDRDGWLFRGAGAIQITGRTIYKFFREYMDNSLILDQGCLYVGKNYFWESAGFWWSVYKPATAAYDMQNMNGSDLSIFPSVSGNRDNKNDLNGKCDGGASVYEITDIVYGDADDQYAELPKRTNLYNHYKSVIN